MVPHTNIYQQHVVNGLVPPIKATCDGDKFEKFELLKERFKSFGDKRVVTTNDESNDETAEMINDHHSQPREHLLAQQIQQQTDLKEIRDFLRTTRKHMEDKEARAKTVNDWKQVALVLDRTFFFLYLTAIVISLAVMFPR
jgi:hypothetical protein